jgi:hypothetical protein
VSARTHAAPAPRARGRGAAPSPADRAPEAPTRHSAGQGAQAGPRICAWCRAPIADDATTDTLGGAELHALCADEFGNWAHPDAAAAPADAHSDEY